MLTQTAAPAEFVLVCDGPLTEGLDEVIDSFRTLHPGVFRVHRLPENRGLAKALNAGLAFCSHDLVARMDSDDVANPDRCALQLAKFREDPELALVGGAVEEFEQDPENVVSRKEMPQTHSEILRYAGRRNPFNHPTVMYRRSALMEVGGYPEHYPAHEDYGLWMALLHNGVKTCNLPQYLCRMRTDGGLYSRRGGWKYLKNAVRFRYEILRSGWLSFGNFLLVCGGLVLVCLVPPAVRKGVYRVFLRKTS